MYNVIYKKIACFRFILIKLITNCIEKNKKDSDSNYRTNLQLKQHTHFVSLFSKSFLFFLNCLNKQHLSKSQDFTNSTNLKKILLKIRMLHIVSIYFLPHYAYCWETKYFRISCDKINLKLKLNTDLWCCYTSFLFFLNW